MAVLREKPAEGSAGSGAGSEEAARAAAAGSVAAERAAAVGSAAAVVGLEAVR